MAPMCDECSQSFSNWGNVTRHAKEFHGPKTRCPIYGCLWTAKREALLEGHLARKHNREYQVTSTFVNADLHTTSSRCLEYSACQQAPPGCSFSESKLCDTQISDCHSIKAEEPQRMEWIPNNGGPTPCWSLAAIAHQTFIQEAYNTELVYAFNASGKYMWAGDCVFSIWGHCVHGVTAETCQICVWGWTLVL